LDFHQNSKNLFFHLRDSLVDRWYINNKAFGWPYSLGMLYLDIELSKASCRKYIYKMFKQIKIIKRAGHI